MTDGDLERIEDARKKIIEIRTNVVPVLIQQEQDRANAALAESKKRLAEQTQGMLNDSRDIEALLTSQDRVNDLEFRPDGSLNTATIGRAISQFKDAQGHILYASVGSLPIDQLRSLRDRVVVQQDALGSLPEDQRGKIEAEYTSSGGKSEVSKPFEDHLRSKQLGERFAHLKQNPPRPFGKK